jgi:hypothetical protein
VLTSIKRSYPAFHFAKQKKSRRDVPTLVKTKAGICSAFEQSLQIASPGSVA